MPLNVCCSLVQGYLYYNYLYDQFIHSGSCGGVTPEGTLECAKAAFAATNVSLVSAPTKLTLEIATSIKQHTINTYSSIVAPVWVREGRVLGCGVSGMVVTF